MIAYKQFCGACEVIQSVVDIRELIPGPTDWFSSSYSSFTSSLQTLNRIVVCAYHAYSSERLKSCNMLFYYLCSFNSLESFSKMIWFLK